MSDSIVVSQRPWHTTLRQDLYTGDGKGIDVDLWRQLALPRHQFGSLPAKGAICVDGEKHNQMN